MRSRVWLSAVAVVAAAGLIQPAATMCFQQPTRTEHAPHTVARTHAQTASEQREAIRYWDAQKVARTASPDQAQLGNGQLQGALWRQPTPITRTVGLVLFSDGDENMSCSGTVVHSANRDTVITAGHCVSDGNGDFYQNWEFIPAYSAGTEPYGEWTARQLFTTKEWADHQDDNYDVGFAVLSPQSGRHVEDVVGAANISFNTALSAPVYDFGYPGQAPFDGESQYFCSGTTRIDNVGEDSTDLALDCDMNDGSSGGPWFTEFTANTGTVISVNSFSYDNLPGIMMGPRLGTNAQRVYNSASAA